MSDASQQPKVLFVDDEPNVLDGIRRQLRALYDVRTADGGAAGLAAIERDGPFVVVVSDMQMPGMNGAVFLRHVRERAPDTVRILLTGHADVDAAMAAVNEGNIFRFLRKPCPPNLLQSSLTAAVEHHRLLTAEKELLERTLRGSVAALSETLALASPAVFGASMGVRRLVGDLAKALDVPNAWEVEIAATMAQLGVVTLPDPVIEKLSSGASLTAQEQAMVAQLPSVVDKLLAHIPRLEGVRAMVRAQHLSFAGADATPGSMGTAIPLGARVLRVAADFGALERSGKSAAEAVAEMLARPGTYDPIVMNALAAMVAQRVTAEIVELPIEELRPGMVFAKDVFLSTGALLVAHGQYATAALLFRLRVYRGSLVGDRIAVQKG